MEWFWWVVAVGSLVWYTVLIFYVGVRGGVEIGQMLKRLSSGDTETGGP